jgi:nitrogen fixation protein NifX
MLKVAFATGSGSHVDQHFGWCCRFDVYEVSAQGYELSETRLLDPPEANEEDKIDSRLRAVEDCAIVHLASIGGPAAARVIKARVHPVKVPDDTAVIELLDRLQRVVAGSPPPWLRKALRQHDPELARTPDWSSA